MKMQIDLKSALCGLIVGVASMFAIGAGTSSGGVGRFQVAGGSAGGDGHFMVIDTATGQGWCARFNGGALQPMNGGFVEKKVEN